MLRIPSKNARDQKKYRLNSSSMYATKAQWLLDAYYYWMHKFEKAAFLNNIWFSVT